MAQSFSFLMAGGADPETPAQVEAAFGDNSESDLEVRCHRKDGSVFWAATFINLVRDELGEVVQHFAPFVDLTKHKQEGDRLRLN